MPLQLKFKPGTPTTFGRVLLDRRISSAYPDKAALLEEMMDVLRSAGYLDHEDETLLMLCFDEALVNAIKHGNREQKRKKVHVRIFGEERRWGITVEDEGAGFDASQVPDPDGPEYLLMEHGRGIHILQQTMNVEPGDAVHYYDRGNRLLMIRRRRSS